MMKLSVVPLLLFLLYAGCRQNNGQAQKEAEQEVVRDTQVIDFFRRTRGAIAMDGGYSVLLPDQRVLWLFGDTYVDRYDSTTGTVPCLFQVRNSALLQPYDNWDRQQTQTLLSDTPGVRNFLKNDAHGNHWIWPSAGVLLGDTVYVFSNRLKSTEGGLGFEDGGAPAWGKIKIPEMEVAGFTPLQDFGDIGFGIGFIKEASGKYVYAYGSKLAKESATYQIYVARFSAADPNSAWSFWNGSDWDPDQDHIIPVADVAGFSWHIARVKDKYVLISAEFSLSCDQGKEIYAATGDSPTGPFSARKVIYTLNDTLQGHYPFFYGAIMHPEYINEKDELLITYCINNYSPCVNTCVDNRFNPDYYRLKAIRVPLKQIDPDL